MRSLPRRPIAASAVGIIVAAALVVVSIPTNEVQVSRVEWSYTVESNATGPEAPCLVGLPTSTPGVTTSTSHWFTASLTLSVNPAWAKSGYVFGIDVQPAGFLYPQVPGEWSQVSSGTQIVLNITTPSNPYGPAPVYVTLDTSTEPGCSYCP